MVGISEGAGNRQSVPELEEMRARLEEAEETLRAIRSGEVDALIVSTEHGDQVFTLQGADRSYRALIEGMSEGALSLTPEGVILYANQVFASMLRTPLENVISTPIQSWIDPADQSTLAPLLQDGDCQHCRAEMQLISGDGTHVPVYLSVNPVSIDGSTHSLAVVATDLTEQKRVEQAIRLSEAKFRNVFENSPLGKSLVSMDGDVRVNRAFCDILGYTEDELRSKTWRDITDPSDQTSMEDVVERLMQGAISSSRFEQRYIHKNGSVILTDVTVGIARDAAGQPMYLLTAINDITAARQADAALKDLKQHLQQNIELERLRLAQNLHDAPLQELYGVIYELEQLRTRSDPDSATVLGHVVDNIQSTLSTLRSTASELRPPALSRFGLEKALRSYIEDFREKHPELRLTYALARDNQALPEDVRLVLFRVVQESFANIVRHADATDVAVHFSFDAEEARIEISDNGKGFAVPGNWVSMVRAGHYGLAGMAERLSAAGGTLSLESTPGGSTTVRAVVPYSMA